MFFFHYDLDFLPKNKQQFVGLFFFSFLSFLKPIDRVDDESEWVFILHFMHYLLLFRVLRVLFHFSILDCFCFVLFRFRMFFYFCQFVHNFVTSCLCFWFSSIVCLFWTTTKNYCFFLSFVCENTCFSLNKECN